MKHKRKRSNIVNFMKPISTDIAIIGGGVAGLWLLNKLSKQGYSVVLCEKNALGSGQTIKSQGIIHGGLKYALTGKVNQSQEALSDMPRRWQECLAGTGEIDLSDVEILADSQYMWSTDMLTGAVATLFASKSLRSHVALENNHPPLIKESNIKSKLYKLSEIVLNVPTLINKLSQPYADRCIQASYPDISSITAQKYIFTAGSANNQANPNMQLRPLHMVLVKCSKLKKIYGHCITTSNLPRLTITSHTAEDGDTVWYLGGKLAEDGINIRAQKLISRAKAELAKIFPQIDLSDAKWASFMVDRAEAKQADGSKPDSATVFNSGKHITAWPTKLALAPVLADQVLEILQQENINPSIPQPDLSGYEKANVAKPIWEEVTWV